MTDKHEPREDFVQRLEWQIGAEVRRRNRETLGRPAGPSRRQLLLGALALTIVSMVTGGAVVAVAYQSQANQERQALAATYERRLALEGERLQLVRREAQDARRRVEIGVAPEETAAEADAKVGEVEIQVTALELQLAEVRITGREHRDEVSAPAIGGRDFVTERWRLAMALPKNQLILERTRLLSLERRFEVGLIEQGAVEVARMRIKELERALESAMLRLLVRRQFIEGRLTATQAELRLSEIEAQQRLETLQPQLQLARLNLDRAKQRVSKGVAEQIEVSKVALQVSEMELEIMRAEYDLQLIRRRLAGKDHEGR